MRPIKFTLSGRTAYGIVEGGQVAELYGGLFDAPERTGQMHALSDVKVQVPLLPRTFYAAGLNYTEHVVEMAAKRGETPDLPQKPDFQNPLSSLTLSCQSDGWDVSAIPAWATALSTR